MRRTAMLWEVFVTRFQEAFEQYEKHRLSSEESRRASGHVGAELPPAVRSLRGGRDRGAARSAARQGVAAACTGARTRADARALSGALQRLHGEALPRATGEAARLQALLHGDQGVAAGGRAGGEGEAPQCPPQ